MGGAGSRGFFFWVRGCEDLEKVIRGTDLFFCDRSVVLLCGLCFVH